VHARADIYSLACVLYEALTGEPPFAGSTTAHLIAAHLNTPPPRPSTTQPDVPPQIDEVIATGMAKDPDNRYAATIELADAARDAITVPIPRPITSPPTLPATEQAHNLVTAQPRPANAASLVPTKLAPPEPAPATPAGHRPRRRLTWPSIALGIIFIVLGLVPVPIPDFKFAGIFTQAHLVLGVMLLVVGLVLMATGRMGRAVGERRGSSAGARQRRSKGAGGSFTSRMEDRFRRRFEE
jgi:serine/threonine protein kinase